jgi:hypothetical protein
VTRPTEIVLRLARGAGGDVKDAILGVRDEEGTHPTVRLSDLPAEDGSAMPDVRGAVAILIAYAETARGRRERVLQAAREGEAK